MQWYRYQILSVIFGAPFVWIGIQHFLHPAWFEPIVPSVLGNRTFWVYLSGVFEVGLGLAVAFPLCRRYAALGIALMLAVLYWANLNMWINNISIGNVQLSSTGHVIRAIVQFFLIILALYIGRWQPFSSFPNSDLSREE